MKSRRHQRAQLPGTLRRTMKPAGTGNSFVIDLQAISVRIDDMKRHLNPTAGKVLQYDVFA